MSKYKEYFLKKVSELKSDLIKHFPNNQEIVDALDHIYRNHHRIDECDEKKLLDILEESGFDISDFHD